MNLKKYKWKYRLLLIETPDYKNENYKLAKTIFEKNIKKFHKRYLKLIIRKKKFIDFNIKLIGFDGNVKKTMKILDSKKIIKLIDSMPMSKNNYKPGNLSLYSDYNKETTIRGLGYKDKEKALYTINKIKKKSKKYQISLINTMIGRANNHQYKTKEMNEAVKIFKKRLKELVN